MKLINHRPSPEVGKWEFDLEFKGKNKTIILKEREHWPILFNAPINKVEKWLLDYYGELCFMSFGNLGTWIIQ